MRKLITIMATAMIMTASEAGERKVRESTPEESAKSEMRSLEKRSRRHGGLLAQPKTRRGKIVFVNEQSIVPFGDIKPVADLIRVRDKLNVEFIQGDGTKTTLMSAPEKKRALGADVVVFISEYGDHPNMMLTAPEGAWSIVNAAAVCKDAKNEAFRKTRMVKMVERGYYCAAGALNSQYPDSLMGPVSKPSDLDKLAMSPPVDVIARTMESLKGLGVTPQEYATYRQAVQQGWAPAPTNDVQKAIWDKVHEIPKTPMKIEFDPKKGR